MAVNHFTSLADKEILFNFFQYFWFILDTNDIERGLLHVSHVGYMSVMSVICQSCLLYVSHVSYTSVTSPILAMGSGFEREGAQEVYPKID